MTKLSKLTRGTVESELHLKFLRQVINVHVKKAKLRHQLGEG